MPCLPILPPGGAVAVDGPALRAHIARDDNGWCPLLPRRGGEVIKPDEVGVGGLILAAPASGSGKTLLTAGLARCLDRRGWRVAAAKAGPDFIDPSWHAPASGGPCHNLDVWAMRPATLAALVRRLEAEADIVLCEGAMGLFDGTGPDGEAGSTAELARITGWPVVLVVDARGQGASVGALLRGFAGHRPAVSLAGVVFNRVSGARHRAVVEAAAARALPALAVLGSLPADPALALPARHLGLVPASEHRDAERLIDAAAAAIEWSLDLDRLVRLARPTGLAELGTLTGIPPLGRHIAVARDDAFCFLYPAMLDGWWRAGAALGFFSPLAGQVPAASADAVYLPGGYPELWAGRIAAAEAFLAGLRRAAAAGKPVYGECGGFMVLGEALIDAAGTPFGMAGLLPLVTSFAERRLTLGYRQMALVADGPLGRAGTAFRGHEFHYAALVREGPAERLWHAADASGDDLGPLGLRCGSVLGSFLHLVDRADVSG
jgi:cobyrinic acid a,c-diamide synthase